MCAPARISSLRWPAWLLALFIGLLVASRALAAEGDRPLWVDRGNDGETQVHLYFYWSESCPHCLAAHPFIEAIPQQRPWVIVHALEVSRSEDNARHFMHMAERLGQRAEAVPTLIACGWLEVGWQDEASSGARLLAALDACRQGHAPANSEPELELPLLGRVDPSRLSLPLFTIAIAALDAFNPCAFFVLLFLLSLLAHQKNRRRMLLIGGIFVATSGLMYFAFMAAWLNVFQLLGTLGWITLAAGLLAMAVGLINIKDFFALARGFSLSIPEAAKPGIYGRARAVLQSDKTWAMLGATVLLAVAANFYELLCTAGFPMVYTRLLTLAEPSTTARYAWLALYNLVYVLPLLMIVLVFVGTLSAHKLSEREGRLLKLLSGTMMLELGILLVLAPAALNSLAVTALLLGVALAVTALAAHLTRPPPQP
jgi:hypothetical protein